MMIEGNAKAKAMSVGEVVSRERGMTVFSLKKMVTCN